MTSFAVQILFPPFLPSGSAFNALFHPSDRKMD